MTAVVAFAVAAVVTFLLRSAMTLTRAGAATKSPPAWIAFVSPAVLMAMVASALVLDQGELVRPPLAEPLAIFAALVAVGRTDNVSAALAVGLPVFWMVGAVA